MALQLAHDVPSYHNSVPLALVAPAAVSPRYFDILLMMSPCPWTW